MKEGMPMSSAAEKLEVLRVIQDYRDGTYTANAALLESVFHEKAVMNGCLGPDLVIATPAAFIADIAGSPSMESAEDPYELVVEEVFIKGGMASVRVSQTGFRGDGKLADCFHLLKVDGSWLIVAKLFTTC
jgi:hypothetical protein